MRRTFLAGLLLALSQAAFAAGVDPRLAPFKLYADRDPAWAAELLLDDKAQTALGASKADAVEQAARLKDLRDVLLAHEDAATMNVALRLRMSDSYGGKDGLGFGKRPAGLVAWRAKFTPTRDAKLVETAILEWPTLSEATRKRLLGIPLYPTTEKVWQAKTFTERLDMLRAYGKARYDRFLTQVPRTDAEYNAMRADMWEIWMSLNAEERRKIGDHLERGRAVVNGFKEADVRKIASLNDPAVKALMDKARKTGDVEQTLALLDQAFDKARPGSSAQKGVVAHAPLAADKRLDSMDPKVLGALLAGALRAEMRAAPAGVPVDEFYKKQPLEIVMNANPSTAIAWYNHGGDKITFNQKWIDDFLKQDGITPTDLMKDKAKLARLARVLAPIFLHEANHHMQDVWHRQRGYEHFGGQEDEIESKKVEALYVLQRQKDPAYVKFLEEVGPKSSMARTYIGLAQSLKNNPDKFDRSIRSKYYEGTPSIDHIAAMRLDYEGDTLSALIYEKDRRESAFAFLDGGRFLETAGTNKCDRGSFRTDADWKKALERVKGSVLDQMIVDTRARREKLATIYYEVEKRHDGVQKGLNKGVADL